jgi:uncharacterized ferritin-like protein (DUF455 family)
MIANRSTFFHGHPLLADNVLCVCVVLADDLSWRMCMVPMAQEARGLDAGPRLADKLCGFGDNRTSKIVTRIAEEEKAHVAVGMAWHSMSTAAVY